MLYDLGAEVLNVKNPRYLGEDCKQIACELELDIWEGESFIFVVDENYDTVHGETVWEGLQSGEYGEIAKFRLTDEQKAKRIRNTRDSLLSELDAIVSNPLRWADFTDEEQMSIAVYRKALLDITEQETFPESAEWPDNPTLTKDQNNGEI